MPTINVTTECIVYALKIRWTFNLVGVVISLIVRELPTCLIDYVLRCNGVAQHKKRS